MNVLTIQSPIYWTTQFKRMMHLISKLSCIIVHTIQWHYLYCSHLFLDIKLIFKHEIPKTCQTFPKKHVLQSQKTCLTESCTDQYSLTGAIFGLSTHLGITDLVSIAHPFSEIQGGFSEMFNLFLFQRKYVHFVFYIPRKGPTTCQYN